MKMIERRGGLLALMGFVLLLCFGFACQDKAAMAELEKYRSQAKVEEQNSALVKRLTEELNKGNAEIIKELYAPNVKSYSPSGSTAPASQNDDFELTKAYLSAFPDLNQTIEELAVSGDKV
ncbi:MAG: ester cyclase, partial [Candidatus Aminicenantes bacterium]|nr:ester cyclase [Candidatus Aminicenantes bacterium]